VTERLVPRTPLQNPSAKELLTALFGMSAHSVDHGLAQIVQEHRTPDNIFGSNPKFEPGVNFASSVAAAEAVSVGLTGGIDSRLLAVILEYHNVIEPIPAPLGVGEYWPKQKQDGNSWQGPSWAGLLVTVCGRPDLRNHTSCSETE
jgi:hypothetical protein